MEAVELIRRRVVLATDAFAEIVVWRVPRPHPPSKHHFRYRLAYVVRGGCVVRYDNERGKGDHRHFSGRELRHGLTTPEKLLRDFGNDIKRWDHENRRP